MPMSPDELISVVIPTYNRAGTLKRAIDSVLDQDCRNIEVIVLDDASSDETGAIRSSTAANAARMRYRPDPAEVAGHMAQRLWQGNIVSPQGAICDKAA
ncbi:MAG: glycosyltransferase family 2 protein [Jhaorihella sp.]